MVNSKTNFSVRWRNQASHLKARIAEFVRDNRVEILILCLGLIAVNSIFISRAFRQSHTIDPDTAGQLGEFVGGYVGPILSLLGIILLFSTLKNQRRASALQNFELKYFELLKMHRDNVAEIELKAGSGKKVFVLLIREFRCALEIVRDVAQKLGEKATAAQLLHIAYYCLFYGVGPNSSRMLKVALAEYNPHFINTVEGTLNAITTKNKVRAERHFYYVPFEGHQSRLGHYYRHLYQLIRYVDRSKVISEDDKYEFGKTVRAQLSTHEQALLLLNSLTPLGRNWWRKCGDEQERECLIVRYRMVQNIPKEFFKSTTELDAETLFPNMYFEYQDGDDIA